MKRKICSVLPSIALEHPCADANAPRASDANQKLQMADDRVRRIRLDGEDLRLVYCGGALKSRPAGVNQSIFVASGSPITAQSMP